MDEITYKKYRKAYSILTTCVMLVAIFHAIGQVLLPIFIELDESANAFKNIPGIGLMFSSALFSALTTSKKIDAQNVNAVSSCVTLLLTITIVFLANIATKGKKWGVYPIAALYVIDALFLVPIIILNGKYPLTISLADLIVNIIFHIIFCAMIVTLLIVSLKLTKREKNGGE